MVSLVETLVALAISALLLASFAGYTLAQEAYALRAAVQDVSALIAEGRSVAQTTGNGATVLLMRTAGGYSASLYPYRPLSAADTTASAIRTISGNGSITPTALFISSSGTVSATSSWTPSSGTLTTEPVCDGEITLAFAAGASRETHTIPCGNAELR